MGRIAKVALVAVALAAMASPACRAGLVVSYEGLQADASGSGSFEVVIRNAEAPGGASYDLTAFSYEVIAAPGTGMVFTGATIEGTSLPYVFAGVGQAAASADPSSPYFGFPFELSYDVPGPDIFLSDAVFYPPFSVTLAPGSSYALGLIRFESDPGVPLADLTPLPDPTGGSLPLSPPAVPEPSSLALLSLAGASLLALRRQRS